MRDEQKDASNQLQGELKDSVANGLSSRRPILTHLNADTTWLLSLPYPEGSGIPAGRQRYNILVDPWFRGPQSDVAGWFSTQWHKVASSVQSIVELNELLAARETSEDTKNPSNNGSSIGSFIDAVVISHEFTDHCHQTTLEEVSPSVPVFATTKAAELIRSWQHFNKVYDTASFGEKTDWRTTSAPPLPRWLGIARLITPGDALYYHSAIVICFQISEICESVIYTPHGVEATSFSTMLSAKPFVQNLALLHGLHDVSIWLTKQLNLGGFNAVEAARLLKSRYWIGTHDEVKKGGGVLAPFLRRKAWSLSDVWSKENLNGKKKMSSVLTEQDKPKNPAYVDLGSGESLVLA